MIWGCDADNHVLCAKVINKIEGLEDLERNQRHEKIVVLVRAANEISVDELAEKLDVSKETIRRDLTFLDQQGLIKKFHGGARSELTPFKGVEGSFASRMTENVEAKRTLCRLAARLFKSGDTLFVDTGSTTAMFAEAIADLSRLIIITNSNTVAKIVSSNPHHEVFVLGGNYNRDNDENVGMLAIEQIKKFHARYAVLTAGAVSNNIVSDFDLQEAEIARAMIKQSEQTIILADHSKFSKQGTFTVATMRDVDYLVTDRKPDEESHSVYGDLPTKVLFA